MLWLIILAALFLIIGVALINYKHIKKRFPNVVETVINSDATPVILQVAGVIIVILMLIPIGTTMFKMFNNIMLAPSAAINATSLNTTTTITTGPITFEGINLTMLYVMSIICVIVIAVASRFGIVGIIMGSGIIMLLFPKMGTWGYVMVACVTLMFISNKMFRIRMRRGFD